MWWPLRRRDRSSRRVVFLGLDGPAPPWAVAADVAALQYIESMSAGSAMPPTAHAHDATSGGVVAKPPLVLLGFADGSTIELGADHPAAAGFRIVAERLASTD